MCEGVEFLGAFIKLKKRLSCMSLASACTNSPVIEVLCWGILLKFVRRIHVRYKNSVSNVKPGGAYNNHWALVSQTGISLGSNTNCCCNYTVRRFDKALSENLVLILGSRLQSEVQYKV